MFGKVMVCTDLSPASDALVLCVEELKGIGLKEVVLVHALPYAGAPVSVEMSEVLDRQVRLLTEQGIEVTVEMPNPCTAALLAETAGILDASVIFVGSHGKGIVKAAALGSVSEDLLRHARRPVLLSRIELLENGKCQAVCRKLFSKVLFPTDFSETAEKALEYVGTVARETEAPVTLLHILDESTTAPEDLRRGEETAQYLLDSKKRRLETAGTRHVTVALAKGKPGKGIVEYAGSCGYSLIVMGFKGKGLVKEVLLGSAAHEAARHAGVPILFISGSD